METARIGPKVRRRRVLSMRAQEALTGWLFCTPWTLHLLLLIIGPMLASLYLSLTTYDIIGSATFVGLRNYRNLLTEDPLFRKALSNTLFMVGMGVPTRMVLGLALAILLNQRVRLLPWFRTSYFLPSQVSGVALALLWGWLLNPDFGLVAYVLSRVGLKSPYFLSNPKLVKPAFVIMGTWGIGGGMVIWLSGLQSIPGAFYEAAKVDGASAWTCFWRITLPLLTPTIFYVLTLGIINTFQIFTQAFILTEGGPNDATLFYALQLYRQAFKYFRMGYACTMAWVLFFIILAVTLVNLRFSTLWVYYETVK